MPPLTDTTPGPGMLLVAPPALADPNFRRAVVFLCDHNDEGSFGLVLNRPLALRLSEVLEDGVFSHDAGLALGGPVEPNTLHFLHRHAALEADAVAVRDGVYWGGDFEVVKDLIRTGNASNDDLRFFLGYAGWSPGQLQEEIDGGGWIVTPASSEEVFTDDADGLWRAVLARMGGEFALLVNYPDDPRMN